MTNSGYLPENLNRSFPSFQNVIYDRCACATWIIISRSVCAYLNARIHRINDFAHILFFNLWSSLFFLFFSLLSLFFFTRLSFLIRKEWFNWEKREKWQSVCQDTKSIFFNFLFFYEFSPPRKSFSMKRNNSFFMYFLLTE